MRDKLSKFRGKLSCPRCNAMCDSEELLDRHREYLHGEYKSNDEKYKRYEKTTKSKRKLAINIGKHPPRKEWILKTPTKQMFIWDCWDGCYYQYHKGIGLIDDLDTVVVDESSDYFKTLMKIINKELPLSKIVPQPMKTKAHGLPWIPLPAKMKKLPKDCILCGSCHQIIKVIGPPITNLTLCPNCGRKLPYEEPKSKKNRPKQVQQKAPGIQPKQDRKRVGKKKPTKVEARQHRK